MFAEENGLPVRTALTAHANDQDILSMDGNPREMGIAALLGTNVSILTETRIRSPRKPLAVHGLGWTTPATTGLHRG